MHDHMIVKQMAGLKLAVRKNVLRSDGSGNGTSNEAYSFLKSSCTFCEPILSCEVTHLGRSFVTVI